MHKGVGKQAFFADDLYGRPPCIEACIRVHIESHTCTWLSFETWPKYLSDLILRPFSATSLRPLRSSEPLCCLCHGLYIFMVQLKSFASIGTSLWNRFPSAVRFTVLFGKHNIIQWPCIEASYVLVALY